jgi:multidrug efflux pump subunit AcrB
MSFIALLFLGGVSSVRLPVSLMPDIDIPEVTVQISRPDVSARELENTVVKPIRRQLLQVPRMTNILSEARDGSGIIRMKFEYGTKINYAFIEVNEKIDAVMNNLPRDLERPRVVKASATDIPVFYVNLSLKTEEVDEEISDKFIELSDFAETVIKKRIEQLPQVALADITGLIYPELSILPDERKLKALHVIPDQIQSALEENNLTLGSLLVRDGQYQYNIRFTSILQTSEDVENIYIKVEDRVLQLKDIAEVKIRSQMQKGSYIYRQKSAIGLAIIKQSEARMADLKEEIYRLVSIFERDYPLISFEISQDQTQILDFAISNLKKTLLIGGCLAFLIVFFFLKDARSPFLILISIPVSVVISLLFFHLVGLSINIISLSGLILGVGIMIDNSIIVVDNITQFIGRGENLENACVKGTNEVIRPLLSSVLTTCAVFIPLIFLSGISGALFYDQAIAISVGLFVSLAVSITLLPTLFRLFYIKGKTGAIDNFILKISFSNIDKLYEGGLKWFFSLRKWLLPGFFFLLLISTILFLHLPKERMPALDQVELVINLDWNESIHVDENKKRIRSLIKYISENTELSSGFIGEQQFLLNRDLELTISEASVYVKTTDPGKIGQIRQQVSQFFNENYPSAKYEFASPKNIFEQLFSEKEPPIVARVSLVQKQEVPGIETIEDLMSKIKTKYPGMDLNPIPVKNYLVVNLLPERILLYGVEQQEIYNKLRTAFNEREIGTLKSSQRHIPIVLSDEVKLISDVMSNTKVINSTGEEIPVSILVQMTRALDYKTIIGGKDGEYIPLTINPNVKDHEKLTGEIRELVREDNLMDVTFTGSLFSGKALVKELILVLCISVLLLYFILASQFESLLQPIIVLLEIPIDIAGALFMLYLFNATINIMSMIGIIVMSGIIINDSILKIDTINHLKWEGNSLMDAIRIGGTRRLKPIIMTSLTTILALTPFFFGTDMGSQLQMPLALAVIGGMSIGTLVSLYFIPLAYYFIYRSKERRK